jgi:L-ascorbate metabolism protein UlaG (beta-lactamase superfamily)
VATSSVHAAPSVDAEVSVEYIAHSCFVVQSPGGTELVIDPFNSHTWLGYSFPPGVTADAVLVSHPHYDHDAEVLSIGV